MEGQKKETKWRSPTKSCWGQSFGIWCGWLQSTPENVRILSKQLESVFKKPFFVVTIIQGEFTESNNFTRKKFFQENWNSPWIIDGRTSKTYGDLLGPIVLEILGLKNFYGILNCGTYEKKIEFENV